MMNSVDWLLLITVIAIENWMRNLNLNSELLLRFHKKQKVIWTTFSSDFCNIKYSKIASDRRHITAEIMQAALMQKIEQIKQGNWVWFFLFRERNFYKSSFLGHNYEYMTFFKNKFNGVTKIETKSWNKHKKIIIWMFFLQQIIKKDKKNKL